MIKDGTIVTSRLTDSVLESITRDTIIKLATEELGLNFEERTIDRTEVYMADEAFLCGSAMEITPVLSFDRYQIGGGNEGQITHSLHKAYLDAVKGLNPKRLNWLTPIY